MTVKHSHSALKNNNYSVIARASVSLIPILGPPVFSIYSLGNGYTSDILVFRNLVHNI